MVKGYYEAVETFLRQCDGMQVKAMALVALVDDKDTCDVVSTYKTGPHELVSCAGILQLQAGYLFNKENEEYDEEEEDDED